MYMLGCARVCVCPVDVAVGEAVRGAKCAPQKLCRPMLILLYHHDGAPIFILYVDTLSLHIGDTPMLLL